MAGRGGRMAGSGTGVPRLGRFQEAKVVAVTGDDNSGGPAPTDSSGINGAVPAEDQAADQDVTAESAEQLAESDEAGAPDAEDGADGGEASEDAASAPDLEQESEIAADYIEGLLDVADLDGDIDMDVEGDRPVVSVVGATLTELVGPNGEVLEALQELTRLAVHRQTGTRSRIMLDVGGYRARRRQELAELGRTAAEEVSRTGVPQRLEAMTPFERKVVHDAVAAVGLRSESEGEEPTRRVVVLPAGDAVMEPAGGQG
jgi:spoIIIJ-associated protein